MADVEWREVDEDGNPVTGLVVHSPVFVGEQGPEPLGELADGTEVGATDSEPPAGKPKRKRTAPPDPAPDAGSV